MEKQKEKEKMKPPVDKARREGTAPKEETDIDKELERLEEQVAKERENATAIAQERQSESGALSKDSAMLGGRAQLEIPKWADYPWMYSKPAKNEYLDSWLKDWCDLVLKWCQFTVRHVVGLKDFQMSRPFDRLPEKELRDIIQYVVDRGLGKWIDKEKTVARIMWRSIEEWANELYEWAYNNGVEILDVFAIKSANRGFSSLPIPDIRSVMDVMAKNRQIKWIDKSHEQAKLVFQ